MFRGQSVRVFVPVANSGQATAGGVSVRLAASAPGLAVTTAGAASASLTGGATASYGFDLVADLRSVVGSSLLTATIQWSDSVDGSVHSSAGFSSVLVRNNSPTAVVTAPVNALVTSAVAFDGSGSYDGPQQGVSEGDPLTYTWSIVDKPASSQVTSSGFSRNGAVATPATRIRVDRKGTYTVGLVVSDPYDTSARATRSVLVANSPPSASIGTVSGTQIGAVLTLDGRASSDPNVEDTLTYSWSLVSGPADAAFVPNDSAAAGTTSFVPSAAGDYRVRLIVNDGTADSAPTETAFAVAPSSAGSSPPTARIQVQSTVGGPQLIELDGSLSIDPQRQPLTYVWTLLNQPAGAASFTSSLPTTAYLATLPGAYKFALSVVDRSLLAGSATVVVTILDVPPVSVVGPDLQLYLGNGSAGIGAGTTQSVRLDGSRSSDPNGQPISYEWSVVAAPDLAAGATRATTLAQFDSTAAANPIVTFTNARLSGRPGVPLAAAGAYELRLRVFNASGSSSASVHLVAMDPISLLPRAEAGLDRTYRAGTDASGLALGQGQFPDATVRPAVDASGRPRNLRSFVRLDGHESNDSRGLPLGYKWTVVSVPAGGGAVSLSNASSVAPTFTPPVPGSYRFRLVVNNGFYDSLPAEVALEVIGTTNTPPTATIQVQDLASLSTFNFFDELPSFPTGKRLVLDGRLSTDSDGADRGRLSYAWRQISGPADALQPSTTVPTVSFVPTSIGIHTFQLTVVDPQGAVGTRVIPIAVGQAATARPALSLTATATTTADTGQDVGGLGIARNVHSLRVTLPTTVTLVAALTRVTQTPGRTESFEWTQLAGPTVLLSTTGERGTVSLQSRTSFSPTTSRVYVFGCSVTDVVPNALGGVDRVQLSRIIRVIVDTPQNAVPEVAGSVSPATIPFSGALQQRTITLDGTASRIVRSLGLAVLTYSWRQIAGPAGTFANPFAIATTFAAPDLGSSSQSQTYEFELTIDQVPPGDRSLPLFFRVVQSSGAAPPTANGTPADSGGLGCAFAASRSAAPGLDLLALLLPLAMILPRRKR
ncbi:MAG: hypothetical protein HY303_08090 [Candidatus Wallbacteria bacterium]|nr:hypothetical protein [Candidatus Wallbacteria bacterium]